jgi:hypothetical protein
MQSAVVKTALSMPAGSISDGGKSRSASHHPSQATPFFGFLLVAILMRIFIPASLLDEFVSYDSPGGAIYEKFHPGAIAIAGLFALMLVSVSWLPRIRPGNIVRSSHLLIAGCVVTGAIQLFFGRGSGLAFLADSVAVAPLVVLFMLTLTARERMIIGLFIVACLVANDLLLFFEYATSSRLLPYKESEPFFRPTALLNHPLLNGLFNATAVPFVLTTPLSARTRYLLMLTFVGACFVAGARFATIASVIAAIAGTWFLMHDQTSRFKISFKTAMFRFVQIAVVLIACVYAFFAFGLAQRMQVLGFHDASTQARVSAFYILAIFPVRDLLIGADPRSLAMVMRGALGITTIENPLVAIIAQFGFLGSVIILPLLLYFLFTLVSAKNKLLFLTMVVFVVTGSSNNTFATKGSAIVYISALLMAGFQVTNRKMVRKSTATTPSVIH